jgi:hypothetical protein
MTDMERQREEAAHDHRRAVRWGMILPFSGGLVLIIVLVIIAALEGETPTSGVANTLLTVLILCPAAICLLPIYLLLVIAVVGMDRAYNAVAKPLRQLEALSLTVSQRTKSLSNSADRSVINLSTRFALLDKLIFSAFDRPQEDDHE